jgi:hypothetical protein
MLIIIIIEINTVAFSVIRLITVVRSCIVQGPYSQHFTFFKLMNELDKLECFSLVSFTIIVYCNTVAYWAH